jgi:hypothetical protein
MKALSVVHGFNKFGLRKGEVIKVIKKSQLLWAVITQISNNRYCFYGLKRKKLQKEAQNEPARPH